MVSELDTAVLELSTVDRPFLSFISLSRATRAAATGGSRVAPGTSGRTENERTENHVDA
jgi:hypothetical protein